MNKLLKFVVILIFLFSIYHLLRDVLQIMNINIPLVNFLHRPHIWCGQYCDLATLTLDLFGIIVGALVLKRNKLGMLGIGLLFLIPLWILAFMVN